MTNHFSNLCVCLILLAIAFACARPQAPTGGPKDEEPPEVVETSPKNGTLLFKGNKISMEFNEYIKLNDIKGELTITPKINEDYEYKYNKRTVELDNLELDDSTTYTFNFGVGVTDITENNPAENLLLIFSTGDFLDSLNITGKVTEILTGEPIENALVAIYDVNDTLDVFTGRASYSIRANEKGQFKFTNIKNGQYRLYAVNDQNKNFKCEPDTESFGFLGDIINLQQDYDSLDIYTRKRNFRPFKLTNLRSSGKFYEARFNKYVMSYDLRAADDTTRTLYSNLTDKNEVLRIYNTLQDVDSLEVKLTAYDTINQSVDTLFYIKFPESKRKSPDFSVNLREGEISTDKVFTGRITFNKPIRYLNADSLFFEYDSITVQIIDTLEDLTWNFNRTELSIEKLLDQSLLNKDTVSKTVIEKPQRRIQGKASFEGRSPANQVKLVIGENAFISVERDSSTQINETYSFTNPANLGVIRGEIITDYPSFIVQLTDKNFEVKRELLNQKIFEFKDLQPGDYKIRIFIDINENGKWDEGQVSNFTEPEPIYHLNKILELRANWELNEIINIE